jgi:hypothetical protein
MQSPSYELMGIPRGGTSSLETLNLSPLAEACSRLDLTAIHEILENVGYRDDEGTANEVYNLSYTIFTSSILQCGVNKHFVRSSMNPDPLLHSTMQRSTCIVGSPRDWRWHESQSDPTDHVLCCATEAQDPSSIGSLCACMECLCIVGLFFLLN